MASANPEHINIIEMPWVNPDHFLRMSFFTDPLVITFVEDSTWRTTKTKADRGDSWMCGNLSILNEWHQCIIK